MLKNFLTVAWRNLLKYKIFSFINIFGLTVAIACCILVALFVLDELSYDKQNKAADRIYRVVKDFVNDDGTRIPDATTPPSIAVTIQKDIPEIDQVTRLFPDPGVGNKFYVRFGDKKFIEENIYHVDSSFFNVFTIPFIKGNPKTAMNDPNSVILTESTARKYFGNEDPIGKTLEIDDWKPVIITAIIKDLPSNTHFKFDLLVPLKRFMNTGDNNSWNWYSFYTYIKLKNGADITAVDKKIRAVVNKYQPENKDHYYSQALTDIHLQSNLKFELKPNSDKIYIYIFSTIAIFILLIACINYVNLIIGRSSLRAIEIGIRKVSGAIKASLIRQFLAESILTSFIACLLALVLSKLFLPVINGITGKQLELTLHGNYFIPISAIGFSIFIGVLAGLYPALYLSSFDPAKVLKGERFSRLKKLTIRKILVIVQFTISIALIIATVIIIQQIDFIQHAKLGLNKDNVIIVNLSYYLDKNETSALKNEWLQIPGVKKVAATDGILGGRNWTNEVRYQQSSSKQIINCLSVDEDFIDALNISIKEGKNFSNIDTGYVVILNETAIKELSIPVPVIGKQIVWRKNPKTGEIFYATIVGTVNDFHFASMKNEIKPFAFVKRNNRQWYYAIKMNGAHTSKTIADIKNVWDKNVKSRPFQYSFLDETYAKLYESEMNFKKIFSYITFIAIFIACLGLFGLSSFITEQRAKEIGIRKVLGASVPGIVNMLSNDFLKLVLISSLISFPLAWWAIHIWLQDFVYRIDISWWVFALSALFALLIALITVSSQAIKAAIANPVKSLRTE